MTQSDTAGEGTLFPVVGREALARVITTVIVFPIL